ncbi:MAG: hypothetical protein O3A06_10875 [Proteobacteria bacterium]|nr:hypothetical protein [Pseudomonadota bacterium]
MPRSRKGRGHEQRGAKRSRLSARGRKAPEGAYRAELIEARRFSNAFGDRVGLAFKIVKGPHAGVVIMETAALKTDCRRGKLAELLRGLGAAAALAGRDAIGRHCMIFVRHESTKAGKPYAAISHTMVSD